MATKRDYYEILGVARDASLDQIKQAYRKLALKYH
ncbi:MAG: DnaJ domain-containing protein, partial [Spirochaetota bacterium]